MKTAELSKHYGTFSLRNRDDMRRIAELEREKAELARLLTRYRTETPIGHQPAMIAHEVDAALAATQPQQGVEGMSEDMEDAHGNK